MISPYTGVCGTKLLHFIIVHSCENLSYCQLGRGVEGIQYFCAAKRSELETGEPYGGSRWMDKDGLHRGLGLACIMNSRAHLSLLQTGKVKHSANGNTERDGHIGRIL